MGDQGLRRPRRGDEEGGWAATGMRWLSVATSLVEVSLAWWLVTLLGGVLLGWLPASVAAVSVLARLGTPEASSAPFGDVLRTARRRSRRATLVGWPATPVLLVLALNGWVLSRGGQSWMLPMLVATALVAAWVLLAVACLTVLVADDATAGSPPLALWRTSLALPLASPATVAAWLATVVALAVVTWRVPILIPLAVPAAMALLTAWLIRRRLLQTGVLAPPEAVDSRGTTANSE